MFLRLHLLLSVMMAFGAGCAERACEQMEPAFQVDLEVLATATAAPVVSVHVDVDAAGTRRQQTLDGASLAGDGKASFVVLVGASGKGGFEATLTAKALDASGAVLATGQATFSGAGDACNRFSLQLRAEAPEVDGGIKVDGGRDQSAPSCGPTTCTGCCTANAVCASGDDDNACGRQGSACADCALASDHCEGGACAACTPLCVGKTCGETDGCGGSCQPGSGCVTPPDCVDTADGDTLLLYTFEGAGSTVTDSARDHDGSIVGTGATRVASKATCGNAMSFDGSAQISYVLVPNSSDWDLAEGSIDFWVRFDGDSDGTNDEGLASRDAISDAKAGHLSILRMCDGSIMARMQDTSDAWAQCSDPVGGGSWHHVGFNFGPGGLQLFVDGKAATRTSSIVCEKTWPCGISSAKGLAGNDNPWTLGAESWRSDEGSATPVDGPLRGRIDSFRISKVRRNF